MASSGRRPRARVALCSGALALPVLLLILSGCSQTNGETATGAPTSTIEVGASTTVVEGQPITESEIKVLAAPATAFSPEQITVVDYVNFGDLAAAHIIGNGEEDIALALFKRESSEWTLIDLGTSLSPDELGPDAPAALIEWAFD